MGPTCKNMNLCCENGHFNMGAMDICSLLGPPSSGFSMYCSFSHFRVGFIFQIRMLPRMEGIFCQMIKMKIKTRLTISLQKTVRKICDKIENEIK